MMLKTSFMVFAFLSIVAFEAKAQDHWNYSTSEGWNGACSSGSHQSPVDVTNAVYDPKLGDLDIAWNVSSGKAFHNGHTIEVPYDAGSKIHFRGHEYNLAQFHFHAPSEHTLNGKSYPLEVHFVHKDANGQILVVGVFFEEGKFNGSLADSFEGRTINASNILPYNLTYFNYNGSLTTPPCSEGVTWIVMKDAVEASSEQLSYLPGVNKGSNNRALQPLNGRIIGTTDL